MAFTLREPARSLRTPSGDAADWAATTDRVFHPPGVIRLVTPAESAIRDRLIRDGSAEEARPR